MNIFQRLFKSRSAYMYEAALAEEQKKAKDRFGRMEQELRACLDPGNFGELIAWEVSPVIYGPTDRRIEVRAEFAEKEVV